MVGSWYRKQDLPHAKPTLYQLGYGHSVLLSRLIHSQLSIWTAKAFLLGYYHQPGPQEKIIEDHCSSPRDLEPREDLKRDLGVTEMLERSLFVHMVTGSHSAGVH